MEFILSLVIESIDKVWLTLQHNWLFLAVSVLIGAVLKLYVNAEKVATYLRRYQRTGVLVATATAVATPLCSCGTTAVVLGMMASSLPWAPIVAFMVASPLTSPEGLIYSAGLFGWPFAWAFYLTSILLGLAGGWVASVIESRGWLEGQTRFAEQKTAACDCRATAPVSVPADHLISLEMPVLQFSAAGTASCCAMDFPLDATTSRSMLADTACMCQEPRSVSAGKPTHSIGSNLPYKGETSPRDANAPAAGPITLRSFLKELYVSGKHLLGMFLGFAFIGYFMNGLIPPGWVAALFGGNHIYNVPLAATLGLPFYINSEASLPLVRGLLDSGMSQGAALAFLIAGAGTSIGAISGALTIARWRVIALVVGVLWIGAMLSGLAFDVLLKANM